MSVSELIGLIGGIAGLISVVVALGSVVVAFGSVVVGFGSAVVAFWIGQRQTKIADYQLFISVVRDIQERYSKLYPMLANLPEKGIGQLTDEQRPAISQAISQYVNLCAEEYLWKGKGIIQPETWEVWEYAIREKFSHPVIRAAWKQYYRKDRYYKGFVEFIDAIVG
jgi:hypothetical protein